MYNYSADRSTEIRLCYRCDGGGGDDVHNVRRPVVSCIQVLYILDIPSVMAIYLSLSTILQLATAIKSSSSIRLRILELPDKFWFNITIISIFGKY
jgi:hypothetical protein